MSRERTVLPAAREEVCAPLHYRGHIAGLDALRGVAVAAVVLYHAYWSTLDRTHWNGLAADWVGLTGLGYMGLHLFFVLSGFLITGILLDGKQRPGAGLAAASPARRFYLRRARRILPAYLLLLAVLWLMHLVDWHFVLASVLFVVNMGRLVGAKLSQFSYLWSLAVEEQFYLVWPWIIWRASPRTIWRMIVACLLAPPFLRLGLSLAGLDSYFKTWANADYLMYGAAVAYALRAGWLHSGNLQRLTRWLYAGSIAGIALSVLVWMLFQDKLWAQVVFNAAGRTPEMVFFVALLLSCLIEHQAAHPVQSSESGGPGRWPWRSLIFLGHISYGLYLGHMLVFRLYDRWTSGAYLGGWEHSFALLNLRALVCSAISILLAWLSRETLEEWFLRSKVQPVRQAQVAGQAVASPE